MRNTEQLAVNAVSDLIGVCPRLKDYLDSNDRTPVTDGHIDLYASDKSNNAALVGRVPVQVKGSATARKTKEKRATATFPVDREVLDFLRTDGGGLYFYVPMRPDGSKRRVFYSTLTPFKIDRYLNKMRAEQKQISIELKRLPTTPSQIERIVSLALEGRKQGKTTGFDESLMLNAKGFTIHSVEGINEDRPTVLDLEKTDFAVTLHTVGGLSLPVDMDMTIYPASYVPHEVAIPIRCGEIEYERSVVRQTDSRTLEIQLSEGLCLQARDTDSGLKTNVNITGVGGVRNQLKDIDFFLAALRGEPLVMGDGAHKADHLPAENLADLVTLRDRISRIVELFDAFGMDDDMIDVLELSDSDCTTLLMLHRAFVRGEEIEGQADGVGRYDFNLGNYRIRTVIIPGSDDGRTEIIDPFDPLKRARFRIYRIADDDSVEEIDKWGTAYEALKVDDLASTLNLRLHRIVEAYESLENRAAACGTANQMALNLLRAADSVSGAHREYLLHGAANLNEWLLEQGEDKLIYQINSWQTRRRQGKLSAEDTKEIRIARRTLRATRDAALREACLTILLDDREELAVSLAGLSAPELTELQGWPIWALVELDEPAAPPEQSLVAG